MSYVPGRSGFLKALGKATAGNDRAPAAERRFAGIVIYAGHIARLSIHSPTPPRQGRLASCSCSGFRVSLNVFDLDTILYIIVVLLCSSLLLRF